MVPGFAPSALLIWWLPLLFRMLEPPRGNFVLFIPYGPATGAWEHLLKPQPLLSQNRPLRGAARILSQYGARSSTCGS